MRRVLLMVLAMSVGGCLCKSREEKLQAAEDEGNLLVAAKARLIKGAGEAVKQEGKQAAEAVAEGTGEVVKGLGQGLEKGLKEVKVTAHADLAASGLSTTRATRSEEGTARHTITAYVTLEKPWKGALELRAYDAQDREVGRAKAELDEKEPTGRYVDFTFDPRTPLLTAGRFELRPVASAAGAASP